MIALNIPASYSIIAVPDHERSFEEGVRDNLDPGQLHERRQRAARSGRRVRPRDTLQTQRCKGTLPSIYLTDHTIDLYFASVP